jgi:hypothetical protein
MSKQTAVEWLVEQLTKNPLPQSKDEFIDGDLVDIINKAKEMEKEQHENTWYAGDEDGAIHEFEYYWKETYGGAK